MMMTFAFMLSSLFRNSALASSLAIVVSIGAKAVTGLVSEFRFMVGEIFTVRQHELCAVYGRNEDDV